MSTVGFYLDIISVFPVNIFTDTLDLNGETVSGQVAKLFPIVQVWHIWDYIGKWEYHFNSYPKVCTFIHKKIIHISFTSTFNVTYTYVRTEVFVK